VHWKNSKFLTGVQPKTPKAFERRELSGSRLPIRSLPSDELLEVLPIYDSWNIGKVHRNFLRVSHKCQSCHKRHTRLTSIIVDTCWHMSTLMTVKAAAVGWYRSRNLNFWRWNVWPCGRMDVTVLQRASRARMDVVSCALEPSIPFLLTYSEDEDTVHPPTIPPPSPMFLTG
jgi:hypothetical protein